MFKKSNRKKSEDENGLSRLKRRMKVVVVGAGATGTQLTQYLVQEGHDVSIIEADEEKARHISNRFDCLVLHGDGNNVESLRDAEISKANALVCVTDSDEKNIIICGLAAALLNEEKQEKKLLKIARVRNNDYKKIEENSSVGKRKIWGVDCFIHPDMETTEAVLTAVSHGAFGDIFGFPGTPFELGSVNVKEGSDFDGLSLIDFHSRTNDKDGIVTLVERGREYFLPKGSTVLLADDLIHFISEKDNMKYFFNLAGKTELPLRRIGIVGGGSLGTLIAQGFLNSDEPKNSDGYYGSFFKRFVSQVGRQIIIVEKDYSICKELAAKFPNALVLNEDISDESFIAEEKIGDLDLIITATESQELNIIAAIYLKSRGVRRVIALVSGSGYKTIALQLGVDVAISENSVVVDSIISNLTGGSVRGIHSLGDESIGIIETRVGANSKAVNKVIADFKLSTGGIIMLVVRGEDSFIPKGDYVFQADDKVTLIVKDADIGEIEDFFGKSV